MNVRVFITLALGLASLAACKGDGPASPQADGGTWLTTGSPVNGTSALDGSALDGQGLADGAASTGTGSNGGSGTNATSATGGSGGEGCAAISEKAELALQPTDVIWAIDDSGSMSASFPAIQQALVDFSNQVTAAGIDAHIVLLTGAGICVPAPLGSGACGGLLPGGPTADSNEPNYLHLNTSFGANGGMATLLDNFSAYAHMLRPGARTHLVLTEDGGPPMDANAVVAHIEGRSSATTSPAWNPPLASGQWVFHGVICPNREGACAVGLFGGLPPATTQELIAQSGGIEASLATAGTGNPFAELLETLAERVVVGTEISCQIDIPEPTMGQTLDPTAVNVLRVETGAAEVLVPKLPDGTSCDGADAWNYDDPSNPRQVVLCPAACEAAKAAQTDRIDIQFGCETILLI